MKTWDVEIEVAERAGGEPLALVYQTIARPEDRPSISIGKSELADVVVPSADSPIHCMLYVDDEGEITVVDRGSEHGTTIDGRRVASETRIAAGDRLEVGNAVLRVGKPTASAMTWKLAIVAAQRGRTIEPSFEGDLHVFHKAEVIVGRTHQADLVLADGNVSRRHCRLRVDDEGRVWLQDLGSSNGTHSNGGRIDNAIISLSTIVYVGDYALRIAEPPKRVPC